MKISDVKKARLLARHLINRCERVLLDEQKRAAGTEYSDPVLSYDVKPSKNSGALRRCSMEMTRQLAVMRRSTGRDSRRIEPAIDPAFVSECRRLVKDGEKINAIKLWRGETGDGLKDAMLAVEALR